MEQRNKDGGSREARGAARKIAKDTKNNGVSKQERTIRPTPDTLRSFFDVAKKAKPNNKYALGIRDALAFALGEAGAGSFHEDWTKHAKANGLYKSDKPLTPKNGKPNLPKAKKPSAAKKLTKRTSSRK